MKKSLTLAAVFAMAAAAFSVPASASWPAPPPAHQVVATHAGAAAVDVGIQSAAAKEPNHMNATMRAKLQVGMVQEHRTTHDEQNQPLPEGQTRKYQETLTMYAVAKNGYDKTGLDEDNNYAKWSPGASLTINVANPALWGKFKHGDKFYVDFTPAPDPAPQA